MATKKTRAADRAPHRDSTGRANGLTATIVAAAVATVATLGALWVAPALRERSELVSQADADRERTANVRAQLDSLRAGDGTATDLVARAADADEIVPYVAADKVAKLVNEVQLSDYPTLVAVAADLGSRWDGKIEEVVDLGTVPGAPGTLRGVETTATLIGGLDLPNLFVDAAAARGLLVTVTEASASPAPATDADDPDAAPAAPEAGAPLDAAAPMAWKLRIVLWYSTEPDVDLSGSTAPAAAAASPAERDTTAPPPDA